MGLRTRLTAVGSALSALALPLPLSLAVGLLVFDLVEAEAEAAVEWTTLADFPSTSSGSEVSASSTSY